MSRHRTSRAGDEHVHVHALLADRTPAPVDDPWLRRLLAGIVAGMTAVVTAVAAAAFVASFAAIRDFAVRSGGIAPGHAWMAPLFVDSFMLVASCADLWCALADTRTPGRGGRLVGWWPKALLVAAALGSFALNIAHAAPTASGRVVAALAPAALVLTFEVLMFTVRRAAAYRAARRTLDAGPARGPRLAAPDTPTADDRPRATAALAAPAAPSGSSRDRVAALLAEADPDTLTGRAVAEAVGLSVRRAQELLAELRTRPAPSADDNGGVAS